MSNGTPLSSFEKTYILRHHREKTFKKIAEELQELGYKKRNPRSLYNFIHQLGLKSPKFSDTHPTTTISSETVELIRQLDDEGVRQCDIVRITGVKSAQCWKIIHYKTRLNG